jgi:hypothetical protein
MKNQKLFALMIFAALVFVCLQTAALGQATSQPSDVKVGQREDRGHGSELCASHFVH